MSYLQCPECRLTVPAAAYYLRGDECPRCLSKMEKRATFRADSGKKPGLPVSLPPSARSAPASPAGGSV